MQTPIDTDTQTTIGDFITADGESAGTQPDTLSIAIQPGQRVGRYRLGERLGQGGMAEVWRARRTDDRSLAAVKFLRTEYAADPTERARLDAEMVVAARLSHPNIVHIYDVSEADAPRPYFITEYLEGRNLSRWLTDEEASRGRLSLLRAIPILHQVADALDYAHAHGIVHRDVKPGNIFIVEPTNRKSNGKRGSVKQEDADTTDHNVSKSDAVPPLVKVLDFGIATMHGRDEAALRREGTVVGTPDYIAPEQATGQTVDGRADQYALAVIAYRMVTGVMPYPRRPDDEHYDVAMRHVRAPIPDPGRSAPELPQTARHALRRALAKKATDRFPSCAAFVDALLGSGEWEAISRERQEKKHRSWRLPIPFLSRLHASRSLVPPLVVAADGSGDCWTLGEALLAAPKGGTILVRPGVYREALRLTRPVTIRAESAGGETGTVTILWDQPGRPTVYVGLIDPEDTVTLNGLNIRNATPRQKRPLLTVEGGDRVALHHSNPGVPAHGTLRLVGGSVEAMHGAAATLAADTVFEDCQIIGEEIGLLVREGRLTIRGGAITSSLGTGLRVTGSPGDLTLDHVTIQDCGGDGVTLESLPPSGGTVNLRGVTIENCRFVGLSVEPPLGDVMETVGTINLVGGRITGNGRGIEDRRGFAHVRGTVLEGNGDGA